MPYEEFGDIEESHCLCGREGLDACHLCGMGLCPMCSETGGGFCHSCLTRKWSDEEIADLDRRMKGD